MNIEGVTLLKQFIEYSSLTLAMILTFIVSAIMIIIGLVSIDADCDWGIISILGGLVILLVILVIAPVNDSKTFFNHPIYTHYIIQIDDAAAWSEIAPNYKIIKEIYPNTGIYEIEREYKEGDE